MASDVLTMALNNSNVDAQSLQTSGSAGETSSVQGQAELSQCQVFSGSSFDQVPPTSSTAEDFGNAAAQSQSGMAEARGDGEETFAGGGRGSLFSLEEACRGDGAESPARPRLGLSASSVIVSSSVAHSPGFGCSSAPPSCSSSQTCGQMGCPAVASSSASNSFNDAQNDAEVLAEGESKEEGAFSGAMMDPPSATYLNRVDESSRTIALPEEAECDIFAATTDQSKSHLRRYKSPPEETYPRGPASNRAWGISFSMGLRGGGETATNSGGWGPTPQGSSSTPSWGSQSQAQGQGQWGAGAANTGNRSAGASQGPVTGPPPTLAIQPQQQQQQQTPPVAQQQSQPASGWDSIKGAPQANRNSTPSAADNSTPGCTSATAGVTTSGETNTSAGGGAQSQVKISDTMANYRDVIFSLDGWGGNQVNQDTAWDVPASPEPPTKDIPLWKQTASNGTEVWQNTLRNGGQIPVQPPQPKTPWGHTPSTNIGGTWGEDDDTGDSSSMWTGAPSTNPAPSQWGAAVPGPVGGAIGASPGPAPVAPGNSMWGGPKKENDWGAQPPPTAAGWGVRMEPDNLGIGTQWKSGGGQWGSSAPTKELGGWGDQSPTSQKRQLQKTEDGTAAWGNPNPQPNKWQEMPAPNIGGRPGMQPSVPPPGRLPPGPALKDTSMWGPPKNGSWNDTGATDNGMNIWMDGRPGPQWNEPQTPTWQKPKTPTTPSGWGDSEVFDTPSWGHPPKQGPKSLTKEMIWSSKQFRVLSEMGFKKDDVENALRASNMVVEDALEMLYSGRVPMNSWRPSSDEHSGLFDPSASGGPYGGSSRFGPGGQQIPFQGGHVLNNPAPLGFTPGLMQKTVHPPPIPPQGSHYGGGAGGGAGRGGLRDVSGVGSAVGGGQPSQAQLRGLVQQIQMAVHAGHLNPQILNQPLAPQTLILLTQLLQHLKVYQQLMSQQAALGNRPQMGGPSMQVFQQLSKTKQQIASLQNQITTQQSLYIKHQQQGQFMSGQQPPGAPPTQPGDMFKAGGSLVDQLPSKFDQISLQDNQLQSRLNKWKLDKSEMDLDFSRAPGGGGGGMTTPGSGAKPPLGSSLSSPLLVHSEGTWSRAQSEGGWPDSGADLGTPSSADGKDTWANAGSSVSSAYSSLTDLVPEFKPGEPWKGPLLKTAEEDPTLTPAQFMATDNYASSSKTSPPPSAGSNDSVFTTALSSSTWSFNSAGGGASQAASKFGPPKTSSWSDSTPSGGDLWGAPKPRGPPPGMSTATKRDYGVPGTWSGSLNGNSAWLILRNLTPQIDGSTLKTLCAQHGPVLNFHLYLNHGVALVRYSSGEEAAKAQGALNNCVLGNTTILADLASESDVQGWLQQLGMPPQQQQQAQQPGTSNWNVRGSTPGAPGGNGGGNGGSSNKPGSSASDTWGASGSSSSSMWGAPSSSSVWSNSSLERSSNSSSSLNAPLNSFLPGDLLGNESM